MGGGGQVSCTFPLRITCKIGGQGVQIACEVAYVLNGRPHSTSHLSPAGVPLSEILDACLDSNAALPQADKTRRNDEGKGQRNVEKRQQLYHHGQKVMLLVNLFLSSHCTVDKDILPGDIVKLRVYDGQLSNERYRQTILNMLNFLCPSGKIGQRYIMSAARTAAIPIC